MDGRQRNVRFSKWIHDEIEAIAEEKGETFTDIVNILLESELNYMGYTKAKYDAKRLNIGRCSENQFIEDIVPNERGTGIDG
jgi:hypothetical protein